MLVRFNKRTIVGGSTYAKDSEHDLANDLADQVVEAGNGVVVGFGAYSNEARFATDASGNVTGLVGADGKVHATLGSNVLTVGAGGRFATLQEAITYLATLPQFELVTGIGTSPTVTAWNQGSDQLTTTGLAGQQQLNREGYWFTHASLGGRLYPIDMALGVAGTPLVAKFRRSEASFSGSEALSFYKPIMHTIYILPGTELDENILIPGSVCMTILGDGNTRWDGTISGASAITHGIWRIQGIESSTISKARAANATGVALELIDCHQNGINDGWLSPEAKYGSIDIIGGSARQSTSISLGHFIVAECAGDLTVDGLRVEVDTQNTLPVADYRLVDIDTVGAYRKIVTSRVILDVYDPNGGMKKCAIIGDNYSPAFVTGCQINYYSPVASTTELAIAHDDMDGAVGSGLCVITGCDISAPPLHTGGRYAFKANNASSSNTVVVNNCGALTAQKPGAGTLTVLSQGIGVAATNGAQTATLTNLPAAATAGNPNQWRKVTLDDGSIGYIPVWK